MPSEERSPWARYDPARIPTKASRPELDAFVSSLAPRARLLDLGCGTGDVSLALVEAGFDVEGVDINAAAIASASASCPGGSFHVRDITAAGGLGLEPGSFGAVVCQLVVSVVGGVEEREGLLRNAADALAPGGRLYLSASEVSDDVNPNYAKLYERDAPETGERHTYYSRDADGAVLYRTHHFTPPELEALVLGAGLEVERTVSRTESSSRRAAERANFLYLVATKPKAPSSP